MFTVAGHARTLQVFADSMLMLFFSAGFCRQHADAVLQCAAYRAADMLDTALRVNGEPS